MEVRAIRIVGFLSIMVTITVLFMLPVLAAEQAVPTTDLDSVVQEIGKDLTYKYDLITAEELSTCEKLWEIEIPYGIRKMIKLCEGNLLVATRSNLSLPECEARSPTGEDEEVLSIVGADGKLIHQEFLERGEYIGWSYASKHREILRLSINYDEGGSPRVYSRHIGCRE